ncbi:hypothetical protein I3760_04G013100 [Carya illinoinensis]|uniref:Protein RFT1 homolog n=1 Tax=Carya illinoinensis TaxID=32201 RepID=A0A8T1QN56_CARIL|nr:hypothetical protein I3760_04G013100 [Carya illinoinensis]KAG2710162.1 hypothetical protein I3760_04G013100 [Carya illinoinensis]KAG2710163.1 hypothetical protein I3760_04G013100 [Carya illinoinensis]KAG2710164.1 hypothetical protein I3760_04G013100 [Carya illinoinensis]KAG6656300.1 hypothetical protein CIPAW_04G013200 [Carya illinoinensis]
MWKASSSRFCPKRDRGMTVPIFLALSNTLGSLVVRMVFLPLEESSYATFARSSSGAALIYLYGWCIFHIHELFINIYLYIDWTIFRWKQEVGKLPFRGPEVGYIN